MRPFLGPSDWLNQLKHVHGEHNLLITIGHNPTVLLAFVTHDNKYLIVRLLKYNQPSISRVYTNPHPNMPITPTQIYQAINDLLQGESIYLTKHSDASDA